MIDFENKIIELGHGDVVVGSCYDSLTFRNTNEPHEVGESIFLLGDDAVYLKEKVELAFTDIESLSYFSVKLLEVESAIKDTVVYGDWTINFNSNRTSAKVVRKHFDILAHNILHSLAC